MLYVSSLHALLYTLNSPSLRPPLIAPRASFFIAEVCVMGGAYINQFYSVTLNYQYDIQLRTCYQTKSMAFLGERRDNQSTH